MGDKNNYMLGTETEDSPVRLSFRYKDLPKADASSGIVRFRTVTPKQQFVQLDGAPTPALSAAHEAAMRHRELAADHMAASLWLSSCVPIVKAPKPRVSKAEKRRVTLPLDHAYIQASDFRAAMSAAGVYKGDFPTDISYIGSAGTSGDGRPMHEFDVTYYWSEYAE